MHQIGYAVAGRAQNAADCLKPHDTTHQYLPSKPALHIRTFTGSMNKYKNIQLQMHSYVQ